ncbi:MAG: AGE family epimerase/isomerase [Candidatus Brocadiia bacterium]
MGPRTNPLLVAILAVAIWGSHTSAARPPAPERDRAVRRLMREHLETNLMPWWLEHSPDEQYGGFLLELDRYGRPREGDKMLVTQARQIWAFSRLWRAGYRDPRLHRAAARGLQFLQDHFWDQQHGGWVMATDREGRPTRTDKSTYAHAFVIYAGVEFSNAFDDPRGLEAAERTFRMLEEHAADPEHAGYFGQFERDWSPPRWGGRSKSMNTQLHLLEALTELYRATDKEIHARRLREILDALLEHAYLPEHRVCLESFEADWTPATGRWFRRRNHETSYGHNVEFAWLMQEAAEALDLPRERYREVGLALVDRALESAWEPKTGALYSEGPLTGKADDHDVSWWMQAENLVALDWAWRTTGEERYLAALELQAAWVTEQQADRIYGGWWDELAPDGTVTEPRKAHVWHGAYHEVRGVLRVAEDVWGARPETEEMAPASRAR